MKTKLLFIIVYFLISFSLAGDYKWCHKNKSIEIQKIEYEIKQFENFLDDKYKKYPRNYIPTATEWVIYDKEIAKLQKLYNNLSKLKQTDSKCR